MDTRADMNNRFENVDKWIVDTGSGVDIRSYNDVDDKGKGLIPSNIDAVFQARSMPARSTPANSSHSMRR